MKKYKVLGLIGTLAMAVGMLAMPVGSAFAATLSTISVSPGQTISYTPTNVEGSYPTLVSVWYTSFSNFVAQNTANPDNTIYPWTGTGFTEINLPGQENLATFIAQNGMYNTYPTGGTGFPDPEGENMVIVPAGQSVSFVVPSNIPTNTVIDVAWQEEEPNNGGTVTGPDENTKIGLCGGGNFAPYLTPTPTPQPKPTPTPAPKSQPTPKPTPTTKPTAPKPVTPAPVKPTVPSPVKPTTPKTTQPVKKNPITVPKPAKKVVPDQFTMTVVNSKMTLNRKDEAHDPGTITFRTSSGQPIPDVKVHIGIYNPYPYISVDGNWVTVSPDIVTTDAEGQAHFVVNGFHFAKVSVGGEVMSQHQYHQYVPVTFTASPVQKIAKPIVHSRTPHHAAKVQHHRDIWILLIVLIVVLLGLIIWWMNRRRRNRDEDPENQE